jgi:hypothetical protein
MAFCHLADASRRPIVKENRTYRLGRSNRPIKGKQEYKMCILWESRYATRMQGVTSSTIRELLKLTQRPEVISFAGGLPAADDQKLFLLQVVCLRQSISQ